MSDFQKLAHSTKGEPLSLVILCTEPGVTSRSSAIQRPPVCASPSCLKRRSKVRITIEFNGRCNRSAAATS